MQMLGVYWKIQVICYQIAIEIFKIEEEMTEKMKHKVANPPLKKGQNTVELYCKKLECKFALTMNDQ